MEVLWGAWGAQSAKHLTLDFGSGHNLVVHEFKPHIGLATVSEEPTSDPLSPFLCPTPTCALAKINI